jgi:hypothetical protein
MCYSVMFIPKGLFCFCEIPSNEGIAAVELFLRNQVGRQRGPALGYLRSVVDFIREEVRLFYRGTENDAGSLRFIVEYLPNPLRESFNGLVTASSHGFTAEYADVNGETRITLRPIQRGTRPSVTSRFFRDENQTSSSSESSKEETTTPKKETLKSKFLQEFENQSTEKKQVK